MTCFTPNQGFESTKLSKDGSCFLFTGSLSRARFVDEQPVPMSTRCHKCEGCRNDYAKEWAIKILLESECWKDSSNLSNNSFITLTYNDDHIPMYGSLDYFGDWESFLKRFREKLSRDFGIKIRYFMVGEYGSLNLRPHYHAIIFGYNFPDKYLYKYRPTGPIYRSPLLESLWTVPNGKRCSGDSLGYSSVCDVTYESAAYVARYSLKKDIGVTYDGVEEFVNEEGVVLERPRLSQRYVRYNMETGERVVVARERPFMSSKPGISKPWFDLYGMDFYRDKKDCYHLDDGRVVKPPKYFDKLLSRVNPDLMEAIKRDRQDWMGSHASLFTPERLSASRECFVRRIENFKRSIGDVYSVL